MHSFHISKSIKDVDFHIIYQQICIGSLTLELVPLIVGSLLFKAYSKEQHSNNLVTVTPTQE